MNNTATWLIDWYHNTDTLSHEMIPLPILIPRLTSQVKSTTAKFHYAIYCINTVHILKSNRLTNNRKSNYHCTNADWNTIVKTDSHWLYLTREHWLRQQRPPLKHEMVTTNNLTTEWMKGWGRGCCWAMETVFIRCILPTVSLTVRCCNL